MPTLILLLLALVGCAADPVLLPDAGPCSSACGVGTTCVAGACVAIDAGAIDAGAIDSAFVEDRTAPADRGGPEAMADGPVGDCTGNPRACTCPDGAQGTIIDCVTEWCTCPPRDAGSVDVRDAGPAADVGSDVPADVRINCAVPGAPDIACSSHADCARCIPGAFNSIWCCARNGTCGNTSNPTCN